MIEWCDTTTTARAIARAVSYLSIQLSIQIRSERKEMDGWDGDNRKWKAGLIRSGQWMNKVISRRMPFWNIVNFVHASSSISDWNGHFDGRKIKGERESELCFEIAWMFLETTAFKHFTIVQKTRWLYLVCWIMHNKTELAQFANSFPVGRKSHWFFLSRLVIS